MTGVFNSIRRILGRTIRALRTRLNSAKRNWLKKPKCITTTSAIRNVSLDTFSSIAKALNVKVEDLVRAF
jgi:hypothetical protein